MIGKVKIQTITLILFLMTSSSYAFGPGSRDQGGFPPGGGSPPGGGGKPFEKKLLNLTPEQESKLKGLREKFLEETIFLRSEIPIRLSELRRLWKSPNPDKDKINNKKKDILELYARFQIKATENRLEAQTFLTPEQVDKLPVFDLRLDLELEFGPGPRSPF
jgi:Spy/CpxP family protein refolding chaperone